MKGIIFNVIEEVVSDQFGPGVWDELLSKTELSGIYTSLGSYPDEQLFDLVGAASEMTGKPAAELLKTLGRGAMPRLHGRFPKFFEDVPGARPFILSLNTIIHPEVRKLYSGAGCPHFHFA
ncbi:MAG: heme NO-binding domain-containing protein, partial [Roseobacter sp.]